jgi:8-amino-7-oxononanoate synthase
VRAALHRLGIGTLASDTQIIPAIIGADAETLAAARLMETQGILAVAIRPPTVPPATGRLRLTLTAAHSQADLDQLVHAFGALGRAGA